MRELKARTHQGGFDFMPRASEAYYRWEEGRCWAAAAVTAVQQGMCCPGAYLACQDLTEGSMVGSAAVAVCDMSDSGGHLACRLSRF